MSQGSDGDELIERVRALFPYLKERVYLDTASAGLVWSGHGDAIARFYDNIKSRGYDAAEEWRAMQARVRNRLARLVGVAPEDITFLSNTTEGLNLTAHSLILSAGDQIVVAADEFPSVTLAWKVAEGRGVELVQVPIPQERQRAATLLAAITPRTRVLSVSHTHANTGTTLDVALLGRECRQRGVLLVVDGLQALGAIPVTLDEVDVYASSFFKWMLSGFGIAVLITSEHARAAMTPAYRGYANMDDQRQLQYAHVNYPALYGLDATLDMFESIGWDTVYGRVRQLGDHLAQVAEQHGLQRITPENQRAGIQVFRSARAQAVCEQLSAQGVSVAARGEGVRVSPHFYNTRDEIDQCVALLAQANGKN